MLTQKDFYDYLEKNGDLDKLMAELADNANKAKAQYAADQKAKAEKKALVDTRVNALSDLFTEWFPEETFKAMAPTQMAKAVYKVIDDFGTAQDKLLKVAKNVKTETKEIPGGTKTVTTGEIDEKEFHDAVDSVWDEVSKLFRL